ncbi:MAG: aspartate aminotransferase family protein [Bacteroidetes bacterium]|nr:aspartate aminotransferase family protein [Bacteroidota bacterium]
MTSRQIFLQHMAQTTDFPLSLEIEKAEGLNLIDVNGKKYMDFISGISVSNVGHRHPKVVEAIKNQVDKYLHLMVYGEYIQAPQVQLAKLLADNLPEQLNCSYFVNSGSEAVDGAVKLAKRISGKTEVISFKNAYHGSTQGVLSIGGNEGFKNAYRPLIPDVRVLEFNSIEELKHISLQKTACVVVEPIQGEAGIRVADKAFMVALRKACDENCCLLIFDEIQSGCGRSGKLFAFEHYGIVPDILCIAKGMGGGMPIGAFIASTKMMHAFTHQPMLGHITTFGGHPVSCAASKATFEVIFYEKLMEKIPTKEKIIRESLKHPGIKEIRGIGLLLAVQFESFEITKKIIDTCIQNGVITDWFLFCDNAMRIAPPLTITERELVEACEIIITSIKTVLG